MTQRGRWRRLYQRVREYLTMQASLEAASTGVDRRAEAREAVREARQKRDAAEVLLSRGSAAEALRLGAESAQCVRRALERVDFSRTAKRTRAAERVETLAAALGTHPELDEGATSAQTASLRALLRAQISIQPQLDVEVLDRRGLLGLRRQRWIFAAMILLSPVGVAAFVHAALRGIHVRASSVLDDEYAADRAIDGDPDTEWVAGGGDEWLELRFPARHVETVRILNGDTLPDRAARVVHLEFYLHGDSYPTDTREFAEQYPARWMEFDGAGIVCDRIRIVVSSHYGAGAALAEVEVK